jgi:superfamily II DNA or RNA helicase
MWLPRILQRQYAGRTYDKGLQYFARGSVHILYGDEQTVEADVQGTSHYAVRLDVTQRGLAVSCTCPWFRDTGSVCKHVWATIQAAHSRGHLSLIEDIADTAIIERRGSEVAPKAKKPPEWRRKLDLVRNAATSYSAAPSARDSAERQLCYLLDIQRSRAAGSIILRIASRKQKKNGEWGKIPFYESRVQIAGANPDDQRILALMQGAKEDRGYSGYYYQPDSISPTYRLSRELAPLLIPEFCRTGRCFIVSSQDDLIAPAAAAWDDGPPWSLNLEVRSNSSEQEYVLEGFLKRGNEVMALSEPVLIVPGIVIAGNRIARFNSGHSKGWLSVLSSGPISIPASHKMEFVAELFNVEAFTEVNLPPELEPERLMPSSPPLLRIQSNGSEFNNHLDCEVFFQYPNKLIPWNHPEALLKTEDNRLALRDHEKEQEELSRLASLGFTSFQTGASTTALKLHPKRLPEAVSSLAAVGWTIEAEGKLYRRSRAVRIEVSTGIDWFELGGMADFDGQTAAVPDLLKAIRRGETMIRLDDGSIGIIPEEWLRRYGLAAALGISDEGGFRFRRGQAGLLDALLASQPDVGWDAAFQRIRRQLQAFEGITPSDASTSFVGKLREYQRDGLGWLQFLRQFGFGGCLADDMGLGKTVQVLALVDSIRVQGSRPCLVVAPKSLVFNWREEAARFTPDLRILDHTGMVRPRSSAEFENFDVVLTTYGIMRRDILLLKDVQFDTAILDEAQAIKNAQTDSAKAARLLRADHKLALTGTPVENHLGELWSLFEFLNPGLLGTASGFGSAFPSADESSRQVLKRALRPFILRRTKDQVAKDLPPKLEQTIFCEMEREQKKLYGELRDYYRQSLLQKIESEGLQKSKIHVLEALLRLRQAACHPALLDRSKTGSSAKLDALVPQVLEVIEEGHKVLVFSQFTSFLQIVRDALDRNDIIYEYLDGRTLDRAARVERFQTDARCPVFLISLKAGGLGLNLTAADYVFLLDPWWNPAVEAQAIDRTHRIGQSRHVFAYRLITKGTVEERVVELQKTKRDLADAIIGAENSVLRGLTREHLELLLS